MTDERQLSAVDSEFDANHPDRPLRALEYAVVDFETTGSSPSRGDRAVEIGIVRVDATGRELDRYETLLQPDRSPGPTFVHRITARMLRDAPRFGDVAGDIAAALNGAVLVAHNASFDTRFLAAEFFRAGHIPPDVRRLCTVQMMRRGRPGLTSYRLTNCCRAAGVCLDNHHAAIDDAEATAKVLAYALDGLEERAFTRLSDLRPKGKTTVWPDFPGRTRPLTRSDVARETEPTLFEV